MNAKAETGRLGEDIAAALLIERGFSIVGRNVRAGRYEIDVIAVRNRVLVFCEVRTRRSAYFGAPAETVGHKKVLSLRAGALKWLQSNPRYRRLKLRFDVAGVLLQPDKPPAIDYYVDAF